MSGRTARALAAVAGTAMASAMLASCAPAGPEEVHFTFNKREAISFVTQVVDDYNASQSDYRVTLDTSGIDAVSASFVRGNPPDIMLANYNHEVSRFVSRCALSDLSQTDAAADIRPDLQPLLDQYGVCEGTTPALPYSVMAASVIYNKKIFEEHDLTPPTTWDELIEVCDTLQDAGVAPFYATFADAWTVNQGWFDYAAGGAVDMLSFFDALAAEGADVGPGSEHSFAADLADPMEKMQLLAREYTQDGAASRNYDAGNVGFAKEGGAMYMQGPWAFSEIAKTAPDAELGTFPLPMTNDPDDLKVRVNLDLAVLIPSEATNPEGAHDFLDYLFRPEIIQAYNESQLGFVPTTTGKPPSDPRVAGMIPFYEAGAVYQGAGVLIPRTIPAENYAQSIALGEDPKAVLTRLDADWARLAYRQPTQTTEDPR